MNDERIGFKLATTLHACSFFWINFVKEINKNSTIEGKKLIEDVLKTEYRASYENNFVEFDSITDMIYFKMKWS
jgi:hypothetical protein